MVLKTKYHKYTEIVGQPKIGKNCWIGAFTLIDGSGGLTIGKNCNISVGVKIYTHDTWKRCLTNNKQKISRKPVIIGKNCYVGSDAVILKGVTLGDYCVVAANSLVNKSFPAKSVVAGVPAKKIGVVNFLKNGSVKIKYDK